LFGFFCTQCFSWINWLINRFRIIPVDQVSLKRRDEHARTRMLVHAVIWSRKSCDHGRLKP
jgi:hypothetical protein